MGAKRYTPEQIIRKLREAEVLLGCGQLSWYDMQSEREEIDKRIETLLNLHQSPEDIAAVLIEEFGAFPNKSILKTYSAKPEPNYLPEYALAVAIQQVVMVDRS